MSMMKQPEPYVITIVGKGGAGKTTLTYFLAQDLISQHRHILLIDADPTTSHLARLFDISPATTIEHLRRDLVDVAARGDTQEKALIAKNLDEIVSKSVIRMSQYDILVMGQPELAGCFCPSNTLLRAVIEKIIRDYDVVLVDCEAGMEQIHRQVIRQINYVIIIAENTIGSLQTASQILRAAEKFTHYSRAGLILNKIQSPRDVKLPFPGNLPLLGTIPLDPVLNDFERKGLTLKDIPSDSLIHQAMHGLSRQIPFPKR